MMSQVSVFNGQVDSMVQTSDVLDSVATQGKAEAKFGEVREGGDAEDPEKYEAHPDPPCNLHEVTGTVGKRPAFPKTFFRFKNQSPLIESSTTP
jgi:hypothetical protein